MKYLFLELVVIYVVMFLFFYAVEWLHDWAKMYHAQEYKKLKKRIKVLEDWHYDN